MRKPLPPGLKLTPETLAHVREHNALPDGRPASPELIRAAAKPSEIPGFFMQAFEGVGGVPRLTQWADENYTDFIKIFAKLAPTTPAQAPQQAVVINIERN